MPGSKRGNSEVAPGRQYPPTRLSAPWQTLGRWACKRGNALWIVARGLVRFPQGRSLWARITDLAAAMCNGGLVIPPAAQERTASDSRPPVSEDIRTIIQIDGDIVVRLGPRLQNLPAEQCRAVLDEHFRAVEQALNPLKELQALIITVTLLFRALATAWIGSMEVLPLINVLADFDKPLSAFLSQVKFQSHLVSVGLLASAILVPQLLSAVVSRAAQFKLGKITADPTFSTGRK